MLNGSCAMCYCRTCDAPFSLCEGASVHCSARAPALSDEVDKSESSPNALKVSPAGTSRVASAASVDAVVAVIDRKLKLKEEPA